MNATNIIERFVNDLYAAAESGIAPLDAIEIDEKNQHIRVYTRLCENAHLSRNGGDYDYWTDYFASESGWERIERSSCEMMEDVSEFDSETTMNVWWGLHLFGRAAEEIGFFTVAQLESKLQKHRFDSRKIELD